MLKAFSQFINKFSVKTQVTAIIVVSLLIFVVVTATALNLQNRSRPDSPESLNYSHKAQELLELSKSSMLMHRHEKDYFAHLSPKHITSFTKQADLALAHINNL